MKFLQDYIEDEQTQAFEEAKAFFAFGKNQFKDGLLKLKLGTEISHLGGGLYCPKESSAELINKIHSIYENGVKQDLKENGKKGVIVRELYNHEAFYTRDVESTVKALKSYKFDYDYILEVYRNESRKTLN